MSRGIESLQHPPPPPLLPPPPLGCDSWGTEVHDYPAGNSWPAPHRDCSPQRTRLAGLRRTVRGVWRGRGAGEGQT